MIEERLELQIGKLTFTGIACGPKDGPLALCLHGFPQFADSYKSILPSLGSSGYRAVAIDQRGYSALARPSGVSEYSTDLLVNDVLAIAQALNAERFHLIGHDWGGAVSWHLAARFPERLLSLTVLSTPHPQAFSEALNATWDQKQRSAYAVLFQAPFHLAERVLKAFNWRFVRLAYKGKVEASQVERNIARLNEPGALTAVLNWYRSASALGNIGMIAVPTLYIWGSNDQALGRVAAVETPKYIGATCRFEILELASHWLLDEKPAEVLSFLIPHLKSNTVRRGPATVEL